MRSLIKKNERQQKEQKNMRTDNVHCMPLSVLETTEKCFSIFFLLFFCERVFRILSRLETRASDHQRHSRLIRNHAMPSLSLSRANRKYAYLNTHIDVVCVCVCMRVCCGAATTIGLVAFCHRKLAAVDKSQKFRHQSNSVVVRILVSASFFFFV